jgi:putative nucleotidyltransferase with HDIG domain
MTTPPYGWAASDRSLTLLRAFLLASAVILVVGAAVLGGTLSGALRGQAIADERDSSNQFAQAVLDQFFDVGTGRVARIERDPSNAVAGGYSHDGTTFLNDQALEFLKRQLGERFVSVKVWGTNGVLAWASLDPSQIGKRFPRGAALLEALRDRHAVAHITAPSGLDNGPERRLGLKHLLEVYAPLIDSSGRVIGSYEVYLDPAPLENSIAARKHEVWLVVALVFLALYAALILLVRTASRTLAQRTRALRQQSKELLDAYAKLEESSMEAIASLNATVDARDPYTAGHSQRVQRIALAIGEELGLPPERMRVLAFGALFHDIGKLGVPDAILLKPGRLTDEEYAIIKRHAEEGAAIVERFSPLRPAVPVIRHHHEHFTGGGYPLGLEGSGIPLEAAVVGLADAWDAMTTDRPYRLALSDAEALTEIRTCSGSQFNPEIVAAFLAAYADDPVRFGSGDVPFELPELKLVAS